MAKIKCLKCNGIIESFYRHDFKWCSCGNIFIDGGKDYLRYGGKALEDGSYEIIVEDKVLEKEVNKFLQIHKLGWNRVQ